MNKQYFGGLPTNLDVRKLRKAFDPLHVGTEITYEMVEDVLGIAQDKPRWKTVTAAWRKQLLNEEGLDLGIGKAGVSFKCLNEKERIDDSIGRFKQGTRKQMRAVKRAIVVQTDDPLLQKKQDSIQRFGAAIMHEANLMQRSIAAPKPPEPAPRREPKAATTAEIGK